MEMGEGQGQEWVKAGPLLQALGNGGGLDFRVRNRGADTSSDDWFIALLCSAFYLLVLDGGCVKFAQGLHNAQKNTCMASASGIVPAAVFIYRFQ